MNRSKSKAPYLPGAGVCVWVLATAMLLASVPLQAQQWLGSATQNDSIFRLGKVLIGRNLFAGNLIPLNARLEVVSGAIAQVQSGRYGFYTNTSGVPTASTVTQFQSNKWAGLGQAGTILQPITGTYGLAIHNINRFGFYNLFDETRNAATKDLVAGFGTNTTTVDTNQRFIFRYFTGVTVPGNIAPTANRDIMALRPNGSVGVNEVNPASTFFVNAIPSLSRFKAITILNEQTPAAATGAPPDQTFTAIGAQGNSNIAVPNVFGLRSQINANAATNAGRIAVDLQVNRVPQAPLFNTQEAELVWQDLNYPGPITGPDSPSVATATGFDRFSIFFRTGSTNFNDRNRLFSILANGSVGINTRNNNIITSANPGNSVGLPGNPASTDINLDIPKGGVRAQTYFRLSDSRFKKAPTTITNALGIIRRLRGVRYAFTGIGGNKEIPTFGFIAQEAVEVVPELAVRTNDNFFAFDYDGVVPILVEAIKLQQLELDTLRLRLQRVEQALGITTTGPTATTGGRASFSQPVVESTPEFPNTRLLQNRPNPTNGNTVIEYALNDNGLALLTIYDISGNARKTYSQLQRGLNRITINAGDLAPGLYTYTLSIDGKIAGSRKMVITR
jgi:hypothetical protein